MKEVHSLQNMTQVIIYCGNKSRHEDWAKKFTKIIAVTDFYEEAYSFLEQAIKLNETSLSLGMNPQLQKTKDLIDYQIRKAKPVLDKNSVLKEAKYVI